MKQRCPDYPFANTIRKTIQTLVVFAAVSSFGAASSARAQGIIYFSTRVSGTVVAHVYGAVDATQLTGNTPEETPAGAQVYAGARLVGTGFSAQLYGGPEGTLEDALVAVGSPSAFRTGPTLGGTPFPQILSVPGVPAGGTGAFQVRAWDNAGGTIPTWDAAAIRGKSAPFNVFNLGDDVLTLPAVMENVRSFNLVLVLPTGACCAPSGDCALTVASACHDLWTIGGVCSPNPCVQPPPATGACCFRNAYCRILSPARCQALRGVFAGGVCTPSVDPPCYVAGSKSSDQLPDHSAPAGEKPSWGQIKNRYRQSNRAK
jgi:hypothetical protein